EQPGAGQSPAEGRRRRRRAALAAPADRRVPRKSQERGGRHKQGRTARPRGGGTVTAGLFLKEFAGKTPWAHLDIAGPAFSEKDLPLAPKGATGYAVRTILTYLGDWRWATRSTCIHTRPRPTARSPRASW